MAKKPLSELTYEERMKDPSLSWYEKLYGRTEESVKNRLIHVLHEHDIHKIEATYNGGHDEGGIEELQAWDKDGVPIEPDDDWEHPVWEACNEALSTQFFSWALGASVYGNFYVDMDERRVWSEGSIEEYVPDVHHKIDWAL